MRKTTLCAEIVIIRLFVVILLTGLTPLTITVENATGKTSSKAETKSKDSDDDGSKRKRSQENVSSSDEEDEEEEEKSAETEKKQPAATSTILTPETLPGKLTEILKSGSQNSSWGVKVMVAETGQTLFESDSDQLFIPASNRKLFTGALALDQLGPDFVFHTFLYYTGKIDAQGTLNGNLVIIPSGDPTFSTTLYKASHPDWVFRDWASKVQAAGIKAVTGDLLVDCGQWDMNDLNAEGWAARIINDSYAPQTSPLTINKNLTAIELRPGKSGAPASVSFIPPATGYNVVNKTESGKKGPPIARRVVNSHIEIRGGVPSKTTLWSFPIDRPTLFAAANFRHHLAENKIPINGSIRIISSPGLIPPRTNQTTLAMVESPKMTDILNYMMKHSDNHMAEQLYVAISAAKLGKGGYTNSRRLEADLLSRAQIDLKSIHCYDGSGLSEANKVSPDQICKLLTYMRSHPYAQQYYDSMAISGRDGTLRNRMGQIAGRVHAKTGTINGVKTLSGYLALGPNKTISFSFLVNRIRAGAVSSTQDRLCSTIASLAL